MKDTEVLRKSRMCRDREMIERGCLMKMEREKGG